MKRIIFILFAIIFSLSGTAHGAPAAGDIMYRDANLNWVSLPIGSEGYGLQVASGLPGWAATSGTGPIASYISYYGADPTGVDDSTTAINNWLAYLAANGQMGICEPGTYKFTAALTAVTGSNWGFTSPGGPASCRFIYAGVGTNVELMTLGDGSNDYYGVYINGLRIDSITNLEGGTALHIKRVHRSTFDNVWMAGQDGSTNLWNGIYFDVVDSDYYTGVNNYVKNDAIMVKGAAAGQAGLWINKGRILGSACGIKVGGGFGGLYIDNMDIIANTYNVIIDNSLVSAANREIFFGPNTMLDSAGVANLYINDTVGSTGTIVFTGWNSSSSSKGINVVSWPSGNLNITAGRHFNNDSDAIYIGDNTTRVLIGSGVSIDNNGGYGVNGVATSYFYSDAYYNANTSGNIAVVNQRALIAAGGTTEIQYNNGGALAASSGLTYQSDTLTITSAGTNGNMIAVGKTNADYGVFQIKSGTTARAGMSANNAGTGIAYTGTLTFSTIAGTPTATLSNIGAFSIIDDLDVDGDAGVGGDLDVTGALTLGTALAIAEGGTGETAIAAGSIWAANSANDLSAITSTTGTKYLQNAAGTISWTATPTFGGMTSTAAIVLNNNIEIASKTAGGTQKNIAIINTNDDIMYGYQATDQVYIAPLAVDNNPVYIHVNGADYNVTMSAAECGGTGKRCLIITP